jgi:hypothetical protein
MITPKSRRLTPLAAFTRLIGLTLLLAAPAAAQSVDPGARPAAPDPAAPAAPAPPAAPDQPTARETLRRWFDGFEFVPQAHHYRTLGDALGPALLAIATDPAEHPVVQARAISAMVNATDPATADHLARLLDDPEAPSLLRRKAALAIAERNGAAVTDRLVQTLHNAGNDIALREACARALRSLGPAAYPARDALLRTETAPTVRGLLGAEKRIGLD